MSGHPCFATFERSRAAYRGGAQREAYALAEAAFKMVREIPGAPPDAAMVASWYGLLLGTVGGRVSEGLDICRDASAASFWEPRIYEYLARLEIAAGNRRQAIDALERGLHISSDDRDLLLIRKHLGMRKAPPLPFLDRAHPINRVLGKLLNGSRVATPPAAPPPSPARNGVR